MRPEVNAFISESFYEGRLEPAAVCLDAVGRRRRTGSGSSRSSTRGTRTPAPEEALAVAAEIDAAARDAVRRGWGGAAARPGDVIVVAPYNAHVRCLRETIPNERIRIGTVDKFQGQQATVVFYSMASSSSGRTCPRGLDFLFSRNRLNVAISRAQCLAYLVAHPRLLDANCRTVEQMRLANALCRFVELAEAGPAPAAPAA